MPVVDIDSHFYEPVDWLKAVDAELFEAVPSCTGNDRAEYFWSELPNQDRFDGLRSSSEMLTLQEKMAFVFSPELARPMQYSSLMQPQSVSQEHDRAFFDGEARLAVLDEAGIDVQFINPTQGVGISAAAIMRGRSDLLPRLRGAWNTFATEMVAGHTDRLMPVTLIDLNDVPWSVAEMQRGRQRGSRALCFSGQRSDKLISHPDFEPLWSAAEDLGMVIYLHGSGQAIALPPELANNGGDPFTFVRISRLFTSDPKYSPLSAQMCIAALCLDGVLERHPTVGVIINEAGHRWLPNLISGLDWITGGRPYSHPSGWGGSGDFDIEARIKELDEAGLVDDRVGKRFAYSLPLKPSEYINRQVRVAPLIGNFAVDSSYEVDLLHTTAQQLELLKCEDILVFSTDWPHPEGRINAAALFDEFLPLEPARRERFMGNSVAELIGL